MRMGTWICAALLTLALAGAAAASYGSGPGPCGPCTGSFPPARNYMSCTGWVRLMHYRETGQWMTWAEAREAAMAACATCPQCELAAPPAPPAEFTRPVPGLPLGITGGPVPTRPFTREANYMSLAGYARWRQHLAESE
jgi:hypothetical protein